MCFGDDGKGSGYSTMVISNNDTSPGATKKLADKYGLPATDGKPMANIDLTDETLAAARKSAKLKAAMGYGRQSTFLSGPDGDTSPPPLGKTVLGGW